MPICPRCGYHFSNSKEVCPRKVSKTMATQGIVRVSVNNKNQVLFSKIYSIILQMPEKQVFTARDIAEQLGIADMTYNEKINDALGLLICFGEIQKIKFDTTEDLKPEQSRKGRGHKYIRKKVEQCPYLTRINKKIKGKPVSYFACANKEWSKA